MEILSFLNKKRGLRCVIIRSVVYLRTEQLCELEWRVSVITALNQFKVSELLIFSVAENFPVKLNIY